MANCNKGFTVLEVVIALLIAGIGVFALMDIFNKGYFGVREIEDYSLALSFSQEKMEQVVDAPSFAGITSEARAPVSGFSNFEREVIVTDPLADLKQVQVRTYWAVPNGENDVSLTTYFSKSS